MYDFKLSYGEHVWAEYNARLHVSPFVIVSGNDVPFSHALRKGILTKRDRNGSYCTSGSALRFLLTGEKNGEAISPVNIFIKFSGKNTVHVNLYPHDMAEFAWESGYFFASDNASLARTMKDVATIYPPAVLSILKTVTQESLDAGTRTCTIVSSQKTAKSRFS